MIHDDHINDLDEDQLNILVEKCKARLAQLNDAGWVHLWVVGTVAHSWGWFPDDDYVGAVTWMATRGVRMATEGKPVDMALDRIAFRPHEAAQHLARMVARKAAEVKEAKAASKRKPAGEAAV